MTDEIIEPVSEQLEELAASAEIDPFRIYVKAGALNPITRFSCKGS